MAWAFGFSKLRENQIYLPFIHPTPDIRAGNVLCMSDFTQAFVAPELAAGELGSLAMASILV